MRTKISLLAMLVILTSGVAQAGTITLSGSFNAAGNAALVWSNLGSPVFGDDGDVANNVALYDLLIPYGGIVEFESTGYSSGGAEPYFSLFSGSLASTSTASFVLSNYVDPYIDFDVSTVLGAGSYVVALGVWENESFAENLGTGTLGDGFIFLGGPGLLGNYSYNVEVTLPDDPGHPVPDPGGTLLLMSLGLMGCSAMRKRA